VFFGALNREKFKIFLLKRGSLKLLAYLALNSKSVLTWTSDILSCFFNNCEIAKKINQEKKSDRVYILGSGPSINKIIDWTEIKRHDSIGFNFFLLHEFVPKKYFFELPPSTPPDSKNKIFSLLRKRATEFRDAAVLAPYSLDDQEKQDVLSLFSGAHFYIPLNFVVPTVYVYEKILRYFYRQAKDRNFFIGCGNSSIDKIINYCISVGYKEIVLCGIDLNTSEYFYDFPATVAPNLKEYIPKNHHIVQKKSVHFTDASSHPRFGLTTSDSVVALKNICNSLNISLFVENAESRLASILPALPTGRVDGTKISMKR
jgi:hypothetical protein